LDENVPNYVLGILWFLIILFTVQDQAGLSFKDNGLSTCCLLYLQTSPYSSIVVGVVGVVEADFLEPIHNKQEFDKTDRYK